MAKGGSGSLCSGLALTLAAMLGLTGAPAQTVHGASPTRLPASPKMVDPDAVVAGFNRGEATVKIIVNLDEPPGLPPVDAIRWDSPGSGRARRTAIRAHVDPVIATLAGHEAALRHRFDNQAGFSAEVTPAGLEKLIADPRVTSIEPVRMLEPHLAQGVPLINAAVYRSTYNGSGVAIALCDTGVDYTHPRLGGGGFPNAKVIGGYDFGDGDGDPFPSNGVAHGTCCAGIAAGSLGTTGDYIGGVAPNARLYALKIIDSTGAIATDSIVQAWNWCLTHKNDDPANPILVISNSVGGGQYFSACDSVFANLSLATAANNAVAAGITVMASSGNDGYCDSISSPACLSNVISVGAVYDAAFGSLSSCVSSLACATKTASSGCTTGYYATDVTAADKVTSYSNTAAILTLLAPSNNTYTLDIAGSAGYSSGDYFSAFGGTSAACPYAAGAAACLQSASKALNGAYLTPAMVKSLLTTTGTSVTDPRVSAARPRVNLGRAIDSIPLVFFSASMDSDPGWTTSGQWAWGPPAGSCGDPSAGYTGPAVYGYNLSGCYANSISATNWLTTPPIDCSGHTGVRLRFARWLGVDRSSRDQAYVSVSTNGSTWTNVWSNGNSALVETGWSLQDIDISAYADLQPAVYIRWGMGPTNTSTTYCGWNIDDVQLAGVSCLPGAVTGVSASDGTWCDKVRVSWTSLPGAACYEVWRGSSSDSGAAVSLGADPDCATPFDDASATPGMTYYYWVRATTSCGTGPFGSPDAGSRSSTPAAPTSPGYDLANTTPTVIRWVWTDNSSDETGFKVYADPGTGPPTTLRATTAAGAMWWDYTSLSPNTPYSFQVAAAKACGDSAKTTILSRYTRAAVPLAPVLSNAGTGTISVAVGPGDGNPAATTYALSISPAASGGNWIQPDGTAGGTESWQTAATWATLAVQGLADCTAYTIGVKARNGDGVETGFGPVSSTTTLAPAPVCRAAQTLALQLGAQGQATITAQQVDAGSTAGGACVAITTREIARPDGPFAASLDYGCADLGAGSILLRLTQSDGQQQTCSANLLLSDANTDGDALGNCVDACPENVPGALVDSAGCPLHIPGDFDGDGDVDVQDLLHFTTCATGPAIPQADAGCQDALLDGDDDVDVVDFALFQRCWSGSNIPANPNCAN